MAERKVKRTYYSKKEKRYVTKYYTYKYTEQTEKQYRARAKAKRASKIKTVKVAKPKILTSTGKQVKSNIQKLFKNIPISERSKYQDVIATWDASKKGALTEERLLAIVEQNKVRSFIANTGLSAEQVALSLNVTEEDLINPNNWKDGVFTDPVSGKSWNVSFDYNYEGSVESVFTEVKM